MEAMNQERAGLVSAGKSNSLGNLFSGGYAHAYFVVIDIFERQHQMSR